MTVSSGLIIGICLPFLGTLLGSACVFFFKSFSLKAAKILSGFAAGVMTAASVWSLLIPSMEQSAAMGKWSFVPAVVGFLIGIAMMLAVDNLVPHIHANHEEPEGLKSGLSKKAKLFLAVTIHNFPEGMAVGVVLAANQVGDSLITVGAGIALALGIAIQNFPEGAIISVPLAANGVKRKKAFLFGAFSGIVEPAGTILILLAASFFVPVLPYFLSFAAGMMIYVVVEELVPEMSAGEHSNSGVVAFSLGFALMMALDVALA